MSRPVLVNAGRVRYAQTISVGRHVLQANEPVEAGGGDVGPGL